MKCHISIPDLKKRYNKQKNKNKILEFYIWKV